MWQWATPHVFKQVNEPQRCFLQKRGGRKLARRVLTSIWDYSLAIASKGALSAAAKGTVWRANSTFPWCWAPGGRRLFVWGPQTLKLKSGVVHLFFIFEFSSYWRELSGTFTTLEASNMLLSVIRINTIMKKNLLRKLQQSCVHSFLVLVRNSNWKPPDLTVQ